VDELGLSYMSVSMEVVNILAQHVMASKQVCVCVCEIPSGRNVYVNVCMYVYVLACNR
jgi:hypothetical protein